MICKRPEGFHTGAKLMEPDATTGRMPTAKLSRNGLTSRRLCCAGRRYRRWLQEEAFRLYFQAPYSVPTERYRKLIHGFVSKTASFSLDVFQKALRIYPTLSVQIRGSEIAKWFEK